MFINPATNDILLNVPNVTNKAICVHGVNFGKVLRVNNSWQPYKNCQRIDCFSKNLIANHEPVIGLVKNAIVINAGFKKGNNGGEVIDTYLLGFNPHKNIDILLNTPLGTNILVRPGLLEPFNVAIELTPLGTKIVGKYRCSDTVHRIVDQLDKDKPKFFMAMLESLHWIIDRRSLKDDAIRIVSSKYEVAAEELNSHVTMEINKLEPESVPKPFYNNPKF